MPTLAATEPDPEAILRFVDAGRVPGAASELRVALTRVTGGARSTRRYRVLDDGLGSSIVEFLDPLDHGQKVLATPSELWFVSPRVHRAIRIPPAQRLFGEASYGDVARVRWSTDYTARLDVPRMDQVDGEACWRLRLMARRTATTYRSAVLWVTRDAWLPRRAEFYSASGKLLKVAEFPGARITAGRLENPQWVLRSAPGATDHTLLEIESADARSFPPGQFTRRYLELHP